MPYNPGVVDQSGQIAGQGLLGAFQSFSRGIEQYAQRRDENKQLQGENKALELLAKSTSQKVGLPPELVDQLTISHPDETPRAKNARLKTVLHGALTQDQLETEKQKRAEADGAMKLQKAQIDELTRKQDADQRNQAAAVAAMQQVPDTRPRTAAEGGFVMRDPNIATGTMRDPTGPEAMRKYILEKGNDRTQADMLIAAAKPPKETFEPSERTMPNGARLIRNTPNSYIPDPTQKEPKEAPPSPLGKLVAERDAYRAAGRDDIASEYDRSIKLLGMKVDAFGNPVNPDAAAPDPFEAEGLPVPKTRAERDALPAGSKYASADGRVYTVAGAAPGTPKEKSAVNLPTPKTPEERAKLPKGTRYLAPDGSIRVR